MGRVSTAFRAFFLVLFNRETATRVQEALIRPELASTESTKSLPKTVEPAKPVIRQPKQSEAITLLATLQREARLVDFLKEELSGYSDEQVGAAVREIHRESGAVLKRVFDVRPILHEAEGASVTVPAGFDAARYRLTGKLVGDAPFRGILRHHGWEVTRCEIPEFSGNESAASTIAPAEVEVG